MSTLLDHQLGMKKESVFGTAVTVDRFYPFLPDTKREWDIRRRTGSGILAGGRRGQLASRGYLPTGTGTVTVKVPLESKGAGVLLDLALGVSTVTAVTGGAQMVFHPGISGVVLPSATIQLGLVDNGGTDRPETFAGCTASKVTIEQPEDEEATLEVEFDALSMTTATSKASATYASSPRIFAAHQAAVGLGGTLTVPTTTALASGLTASAIWRSWKVEIDQGIDAERWILGATRGQPVAGIPKVSFSGTVEYDDNALRDGLLAGTAYPWYCTHTTTEALGSGYTQLQVVIPSMTLEKGLPTPKPGELVTYDVDATVENDGTNRDVYIVYRSTDTAL